MQLIDGTIVVSATDLVGYLACDHLATLELGRMPGSGRSRTIARTPSCCSSRSAATCTRRRTSSGTARPGGRIARDPLNRDPTVTRRAAGGRGRDPRRDAPRRRRHLPGHVLRRALARTRRLPPAGRAPEPPRRLELRRRRHEARPARQGRRDPPGLRVRGPARRSCRASNPSASSIVTGDNKEHVRAAGRLRRLLPDRQGALRGARLRRRPRPRPTPTRSTTAGSAPGSRPAWTAAGRTTTSRSWPA